MRVRREKQGEEGKIKTVRKLILVIYGNLEIKFLKQLLVAEFREKVSLKQET